MNARSAIPVVVLALLLAGGVLYFKPAFLQTYLRQIYTSDIYGLSFRYPAGYSLREADPVSSGPTHHAIVLSRIVDGPVPKNSDSPPNIFIGIYRNDTVLDLENWVRGSRQSNFTQSIDGKLYSVTIGGKDGFFYRWDGLYRADTYAASNRGYVILFSGSYNSPDDQIHKDLLNIVDSVHLN